MSETGDKVVSDEEVLCASCGHMAGCHPGFCSCRAGLCRCGSFVKLHRPEKVAFEAQHRPASQPQNANLPPDRCGGDGTYQAILERDLDAFEIWWASYSLRPDAHVDSQRDSRAAWEAACAASIKPEAPEGAKELAEAGEPQWLPKRREWLKRNAVREAGK